MWELDVVLGKNKEESTYLYPTPSSETPLIRVKHYTTGP